MLPAGPTVTDVLANAAFYYGLVRALAEDARPVWTRLPFAVGGRELRRRLPLRHRRRAAVAGAAARRRRHPGARGQARTRRTAAARRRRARRVGRRAGRPGPLPRHHRGAVPAAASTARPGRSTPTTGRWRRGSAREAALAATTRRYRELMHQGEPVHTWPMGFPDGPERGVPPGRVAHRGARCRGEPRRTGRARARCPAASRHSPASGRQDVHGCQDSWERPSAMTASEDHGLDVGGVVHLVARHRRSPSAISPYLVACRRPGLPRSRSAAPVSLGSVSFRNCAIEVGRARWCRGPCWQPSVRTTTALNLPLAYVGGLPPCRRPASCRTDRSSPSTTGLSAPIAAESRSRWVPPSFTGAPSAGRPLPVQR